MSLLLSNINDLEMLEYAGLGIAMGNAPEAVKQKADLVTACNDEDGIAIFIEGILGFFLVLHLESLSYSG